LNSRKDHRVPATQRIPTTMAKPRPTRLLFATTVGVLCVPYYLTVSFFLFFPSGVVRVTDAAHPRRRATVRRNGAAAYDREITTFTEDGRLAQVEYGLEASVRGSTVGAIKVRIPSEGGGSDNDGDGDGDGQEATGTPCIVVCIENSSFGKMHRIDDHLWMLTAGLAGDARMLANQARRSCQNHRLRCGEAATVRQAARSTADFYHQLTRIGGCRPLGCTAILVGIDGAGEARIFRTDPGGGFEECLSCTAGRSQALVGKEMVDLVEKSDEIIGGEAREEARDNTESDNDDETIKKNGRIARIASTMAEKFLGLVAAPSDGKNHPQATTLDVWTIQPMQNSRGGMLATCYSDVRKDNVDGIALKETG